MILKIVGSVVIIFACTGLGFEKTQQMKLHIRQLEELKKIITFIRSELYYKRTPFIELFENASKNTNGIFCVWLTNLSKELQLRHLGSFEETWRQTIEAELGGSYMSPTEIDALLQLGTSLNQIESLDLYLEQLDLSIQSAREEENSQKKLYQSMGVLGGIFLVIILL